MESKAVKELQRFLLAENRHPGFQIFESGLVISLENPFLAASPDRIIRCECHGYIVVEVKCPYTHRDSTITGALESDKQFCLKLSEDGSLQLKRNHPYFYQVILIFTDLFVMIDRISNCSTFPGSATNVRVRTRILYILCVPEERFHRA